MTTRFRATGAFLLAATLAFATGCGQKTATVKGVVKVDGKPLPNGSVSFRSSTGLVVDAPIQSDGTYTAPNVPVGEAQVLVSAMDPKFEAKMNELVGRGPAVEDGKSLGRGKLNVAGVGGGGRGAGDVQAQYTLVDSKFNNYETSGLKVNVAGPETVYDIPVTKTK